MTLHRDHDFFQYRAVSEFMHIVKTTNYSAAIITPSSAPSGYSAQRSRWRRCMILSSNREENPLSLSPYNWTSLTISSMRPELSTIWAGGWCPYEACRAYEKMSAASPATGCGAGRRCDEQQDFATGAGCRMCAATHSPAIMPRISKTSRPCNWKWDTVI